MLLPKKVKYRKQHKGRSKGMATRKIEVSFGSYGLLSLGTRWVSSRQIEATRRTITRFLKKGGKLWIRIFPDKPVTSHGAEMPMGKGKGSVDHYVVPVKPGMVLFELDGIDRKTAMEAFRLAGYKLPIKTRFIEKE